MPTCRDLLNYIVAPIALVLGMSQAGCLDPQNPLSVTLTVVGITVLLLGLDAFYGPDAQH